MVIVKHSANNKLAYNINYITSPLKMTR